MDWRELIGYFVAAITGIVGWLTGRRKSNNDFIADLQGSITLLSENYTKTLNELIEMKMQNAELLTGQHKMKSELDKLRHENKLLREEIGYLNEKLQGVKTITRTR